MSESEITLASDMLTNFADDFEEIYGDEAVTMNVHHLRHYGLMVKHCGPIWCYSMFGFEKNIGILSKSIVNPTDAIETISFDYCLNHPKNSSNINEVRMLCAKKQQLPDFIKSMKLNFAQDKKYTMSDSIEIKSQKFKSLQSKETKSIDFFMQMQNGKIGCAINYIEIGDRIHVILQKYEMFEQAHHLMRIKPTAIYHTCLCSDISCKLLYMKFGAFEIVAKEPNLYEIN